MGSVNAARLPNSRSPCQAWWPLLCKGGGAALVRAVLSPCLTPKDKYTSVLPELAEACHTPTTADADQHCLPWTHATSVDSCSQLPSSDTQPQQTPTQLVQYPPPPDLVPHTMNHPQCDGGVGATSAGGGPLPHSRLTANLSPEPPPPALAGPPSPPPPPASRYHAAAARRAGDPGEGLHEGLAPKR